MSLPASVSIALLGGPESGKTTYLGALADALTAGISPALRIARAAADARGFLRLMEPLQRGNYPRRTNEERHRFHADLDATSPDGARTRLTLEVGDYDGEEVERLFKREGPLTEEWRARAEARGVLLFLRHDATTPLPKDARPAPTDSDRWEAITARSAAPPARSPTNGDDPMTRLGYGLSMDELAPPPAQPLDRVRVPTTLALIEVLQFLRHVRGLDPGERPPTGTMRVAIVLSAWDAVDSAFREGGPMRYLIHELPLLHDFLWSNYRDEDIFCFGVSSTGGDLKRGEHKDRYLEEPGGFVAWTEPAGRVHRTGDLTLPVRWALFGDGALRDD